MCKSIKIFCARYGFESIQHRSQNIVGVQICFNVVSAVGAVRLTQALQSSNKNCHEVLFEEHGKFCEKRTRHLFAVIFNSTMFLLAITSH